MFLPWGQTWQGPGWGCGQALKGLKFVVSRLLPLGYGYQGNCVWGTLCSLWEHFFISFPLTLSRSLLTNSIKNTLFLNMLAWHKTKLVQVLVIPNLIFFIFRFPGPSSRKLSLKDELQVWVRCQPLDSCIMLSPFSMACCPNLRGYCKLHATRFQLHWSGMKTFTGLVFFSGYQLIQYGTGN